MHGAVIRTKIRRHSRSIIRILPVYFPNDETDTPSSDSGRVLHSKGGFMNINITSDGTKATLAVEVLEMTGLYDVLVVVR